MKQFLGKKVAGVRIRAEPSFMSPQLGVIKPGQSFSYTEEIKNDAGTWVKLSNSALKYFDCSASVAYTLCYSTEKKEEFLVEKEPPPDMIHTVKKRVVPRKPSSPRKRQGGPGIYEVVQCGSAGHNVRSKPGMRGTPVGRLAKGNRIEAIEEVENDDGIWLKFSKDSVKKFCDTQVDSWTLAVALSGRIFLSLEGDESYQSQVINMAPQTPAQPVFPTAASVFGTPPQQKSIFGTPLVPPAPPPPALFQFGVPKLQFGSTAEEPSKRPLFKFGSLLKRMKKSEKAKGGDSSMVKPSFSIGSARGPVVLARAHRRSKPAWVVKHTKSASEDPPKTDAAKEEEEEEEEERSAYSEPEESLALQSISTSSVQRQALSPAVAECQRAIYAAFLWQEGLVHDALASAAYLKFHPELTKEMKMEPKIAEKEKEEEESEQKEGEEEKVTEEGGRKGEKSGDKKEETKEGEDAGKSAEEGKEHPVKKDEKKRSAKDVSPEKQETIMKSPPSFMSSESDLKMAGHTLLPPTLNHLVTFWDEISAKVLNNSSVSFAPPKVPEVAQELQKRYEEEKKELEMRKKEKDKKPGAGGGGGSTACELCDQSYPDPVTYHMKEVHPGCGKHAKGWGYNSRGTFCSGWAGNCGDGGRGGSTWYLMCKECHTKYLAIKEEGKKKAVRTTPMPKMKTRKPGKPRVLPVISAVQGMIQNAKFLLEISCPFEKPATTPTTMLSPGPGSYMKQASLGRTESFETDTKKILTVTSDSDTNSEQRPAFLRSISLATHSSDKFLSLRRNTSIESRGKEESPLPRQRTAGSSLASSELSVTGPLVAKPSIYLARLMYNRSRHGAENKEIGYKKLLAFVLQYHDLNGLRVMMKQSMRVAGVRTFAMECLQWLLQMVRDPCIVHDILWQFSRALSTHPLHQMASKVKADKEREEKGQKQLKVGEGEEFFLGKHPLTSLEGAGFMQQLLRSQFHCLLQAVANKMPGLPMGSAVQRMAMQCWCLHFQPPDHSFLLQSNVFANISQALSGADEGEATAVVEKRGKYEKATEMTVMEDILSKGRLKVSSNEAMVDSLTDGSTETFWESLDEPRGRSRQLTVTFEQEKKVFAVAVHIDNQKDSGQRVESVSLLVGREEDGLREADSGKLAMMHCGWRILVVPPGEQVCSVVRLEVKGLQNNIRVRQLQVLAPPTRRPDAALTSVSAQQKACEEEALRVFRLLTSQVFGGLLMKLGEEDSEEDADSVAPKEGEKEEEVREHMADILLAKNKLSSLQKQVCVHIIQSVHTECEKMREEWEGVAAKAPPPKLSRQPSSADAAGSEATGRGSDTYCYELLSMLIGLSQSDIGCAFLSQQEKLAQELFSLLHIATPRIQMQSLSLLRHILPVMGPKNLAPMIGVLALPPIGYSAIAEAVNSAATLNTLGILDCLLAVIAKALSVQVKAKGHGTNVLQALIGDSTVSAVTFASLINPSPVPGETTIRNQRWYLKSSIDNEVASEVVKLMKDMTKGVFGAQWQGMSKAAIGQAVLHLTKINEEARVPNPGMYSQTLWLCLAALCVIDEEHAEALSSGQWLGQDGKPKDKPLCDNHDDGETQALILCDRCGNLCGECDRVLHYSKKSKHHQRQVFKEEEEAVKVELHEGCGRIKLYWTMALADYRTLKGLIEFKETGSGGGKGACRFCGTVSNTGLLAIGSVCADPECQERAANVCDKTLPCGHACCGVKEEESCLPCLHGCAPPETNLKQDADDMCMVCYIEGLSCAACIQLKCGHVFHYHCCRNSLVKKWSGPMITFRFMFCSLCVNIPISHPALSDVQTPVGELYDDVKRKCLLRLEYENQMQCEALIALSSKFYQKPLEYGMSKYAYYVCYKCKKSYYGGEAHCAQAAAVSDEYDPSELVCPSCSNVGGVAIQVCPKHGTDFLEYKCRYCCSVAVYFCFGTTHFCNPCHDDFQRLTSMAKSELPQCPVGPSAKPLEGTECPLHVKHPLTGEEFALGCGVCRNAQTF